MNGMMKCGCSAEPPGSLKGMVRGQEKQKRQGAQESKGVCHVEKKMCK